MEHGGRTDYLVDKRFKRRIIKLPHMSLWESIRILERDKKDFKHIYYHRGFGISEEVYNINFFRNLQIFLNKLFSKYEECEGEKVDYFLKRYRFIGDLFIEVKRDRKLKQLGI